MKSIRLSTYVALLQGNCQISEIRMTGSLLVLLQFLLFIIYLMIPAGTRWSFPGWLRLGGIALLPYGFILVVWAIWSLRRSLRVHPAPAAHAELVTDGPFRHIRHPIYTGILILALGYALWSQHPGRIGVTLLLGLLFWVKGDYEERLLRQQFPHYADYVARTGRLWPQLRNWISGE